jgi:hypothetical protein
MTQRTGLASGGAGHDMRPRPPVRDAAAYAQTQLGHWEVGTLSARGLQPPAAQAT